MSSCSEYSDRVGGLRHYGWIGHHAARSDLQEGTARRGKAVVRRLFLILWFGLGATAHAESFSAKVTTVTDGDDVTVLTASNDQVRVRLEGIDAPERGQDFSNTSRRYLSSLVHGKTVVVETTGRDRYGRILGKVSLDGQDVNLAMVAAGLAWHYKRYSDDAELAAAEKRARDATLGIWSRPDVIAPWEWRNGQREASIISQPAPPSAPRSSTGFRCGSKRFCREMTSCAEARFYLRACGLTRLDGDGDGIPCESLCP